MHPSRNNIGAYIAAQGNIKPQSLSGATPAEGDALDRQNFGSCVLLAQVGDATGSPTSYAVTVKLQESDTTTGGDFTDVAGKSFVLDADGESADLDVDLRTLKRYIRLVATPAFTGGTSPTVSVQGSIITGGDNTLPL